MDKGKGKVNGFKKWMDSNKNVDHIGKVATFYLPSEKLDGKKRKKIHGFLVDNYDAYTHEKGGLRGYWRDGEELSMDKNERYEVSSSGEENFKKLVGFLSELCSEIGEKCVYLTVGEESYLIWPRM